MLLCSYCGKEIDQSQGFVGEENENGNIVKVYHPICNALANKLDITIYNEAGEIILQISKGKPIIVSEGFELPTPSTEITQL